MVKLLRPDGSVETHPADMVTHDADRFLLFQYGKEIGWRWRSDYLIAETDDGRCRLVGTGRHTN